MTKLHAASATQTYNKQLKTFSRVPLLIIDDFGLKPIRPPHDEDLHELIPERYENQATIITSNLAFQEWDRAFENKLLGAATIDRLRHDTYLVDLDGPSYRSPKTNSNTQKNDGK